MNSGGRFFLLLMACFPACYGSVGDTPQHGPVATRPSAPGMTAGGPPAATPGGTTGTAPPASPPDTLAAPYPVRRLSPDEYVNSVADLLGLTGTEQQALALDLPADVTGATGFGAPGLMGADEVRRFAEKGHQAAALRDPGVVAGCDPNTGGATCVRHFVDTFAARAFRRPLLGSEGDDLVQLYQTLRAQGLSPSDGLRELLATLLQTPQFLYHRELGGAEPGTGPAGLALTPFQVAARLSYLFWRTLPDSRLAQAAAQGQLTSPVDREREARRLLQDPRANRAVERFFLDTLSFDDVQRISKNVTDATFPAAVRSALMDEATLYVDHWFAEDGTLGGLLTSSATYLDSRSAEHYGLGNVTGTQRVVLPAAARAGLLTLGAVMAVNASPDEGSPIKRGALVRQRILCQKLPPMPAIVPQLPSPATGQTQRERLSRHSEDAACSGCHQLMDPVGFAFSAFDTLGRFRPDPGGTDSSGYVLGLDGGDRTPFSGLGDFMALLSHSQNAQSCAVQQWFQFALARPTTPDDGPILDQAWRAFASSGQDVRELLIFLVRSPAFATRTTAGVTP